MNDKTVEFTDLTVSTKYLTKEHGRFVKHHWGRNWTRIEIPIPNNFSSPDQIKQWIINNLSGGRFGLFYRREGNNNISTNEKYWERNYILIIGFEDEEDAIMFKMLDGHQAFDDEQYF